MEIPQEASKHQKSIIKKGNVFVCLLCNAEKNMETIKARIKKPFKKRQMQTIFTCNTSSKQLNYNLNLKDILKSIEGPFLAVTTA